MSTDTLLKQIQDFDNRPDPYPLYREIRKTPVSEQEDGSFVVSTYNEVRMLLHDPRISSDERLRTPMPGDPPPPPEGMSPPLIRLDPPEHDRLRRLMMRSFGPPHTPRLIDELAGDLQELTASLVDKLAGKDQVDLTEEVAHPLPVTAICRVLGVPREDEPKFSEWALGLIQAADPSAGMTPEEADQLRDRSRGALAQYMGGLIEKRKAEPQDDMLSRMLADDDPEGPIDPVNMVIQSILLLIAGHETTVNLISNGMLTLLRFPQALEQVRENPGLVSNVVEELLRYEPPVQMLPQRTPLSDVEIRGVTIPKGAHLVLLLAAANRDPDRFEDPDRFIPDRQGIEHLGFGSGIHSCFGAPMARLEAQIALSEMVGRLENPRLIDDPPPYRHSPVLRGPKHLLVEIDGVRGRS